MYIQDFSLSHINSQIIEYIVTQDGQSSHIALRLRQDLNRSDDANSTQLELSNLDHIRFVDIELHHKQTIIMHTTHDNHNTVLEYIKQLDPKIKHKRCSSTDIPGLYAQKSSALVTQHMFWSDQNPMKATEDGTSEIVDDLNLRRWCRFP